MTVTRSVLFASLLGTAMFGCRNTSDNRDDMNRSPKPVESTTPDQNPPAAEPMKGGNATGTTTTGAPDPWATTGSADQGMPQGTTPTTPGTPGTTPTTPGTPGTTPTTPGTPGTPTTTPTPETPPPGTTGSAVGSAENIPAPAATGSETGAQGYDQGSAAVPSTGSSATPGSMMDTYGSAAGSADQGTLDQRGGSLNGNPQGDKSNQP